jgi:acylphosphatase
MSVKYKVTVSITADESELNGMVNNYVDLSIYNVITGNEIGNNYEIAIEPIVNTWHNASLSFNNLTEEQESIISDKLSKVAKELEEIGIDNCAINEVYWESGEH